MSSILTVELTTSSSLILIVSVFTALISGFGAIVVVSISLSNFRNLLESESEIIGIGVVFCDDEDGTVKLAPISKCLLTTITGTWSGTITAFSVAFKSIGESGGEDCCFEMFV